MTQDPEILEREDTLVPGRLSGVFELGAALAAEPAPARRMTIGRDPSNDLAVDDLLVSRFHAELRPAERGRVQIVDLGSSNGTFVNGRRVDRLLLEELDVVTVGHHAFRLVGSGLEEYVDEGLVRLQALGLSVRAPDGTTLLDDVSFSLDERALMAIVGPSGAGKSVLLNALTGFRPAEAGRVMYGGCDLYAEYEALRTRIGVVPQQDVVHEGLTVWQALSYAGELRFPADVSDADRDARVAEVIEELGLSGTEQRRVGSLSGGERRRVCVGAELITRPSLLMLDEPTSGLDPGNERSLMQLLRGLADGGRSVVVVTHRVQSLRLCDRVLFLAPGGRQAYFGPAQLAPAFFGREDLQDVFQDLADRDSGRDWAREFREHKQYQRYVASRLAPRPEETRRADAQPRAARRNQRGWLSRFWLLTRRYARVLASDRRNALLLLFQPLALGLIMLAALPADELELPPAGEVRLASRAGLVLLVVVLGATWLGASNAVREIVKELPIVRRERALGVPSSAYVASKAVVLGAITAVQAMLLVPIATARQGGPEQGSLLEWPLVELTLAAVLAGVAAMTLGLLVSALARTVDRAMSVLPVVLILQMLLAMGGVFPDVVEKPVLEQASKLASAQWAFSASASTVELDRLQTVDRLARDTPSVRTSDPLPLLRAISGETESEPRWPHDWPTWLKYAGALVGLSAAGIAAAMLAMRRLRPET